ncbi:hypothetical protein G6F68_012711 [Rhizopus microsporus]|nr:hypothetical protein G6F68_012711 [Rhizopus microsporus]
MVAAEQREGAGQVSVAVAARILGIASGSAQVDARAGVRVRVAGAVQAHVLHVATGVGGVDLQQPVLAEALFQIGKGGIALALPVAPLRRQVGRTREMGEVALVVEERDGAPGRAGGVVVLALVTEGEGGAVGDIAFQYRHGGHLGLVVAVVVQPSIGVGGHHPAAEAAIVGERRGHVGLHAAVVPAAGTDRERSVELLARTLAQQVDRGRRHARAAEQAVGAADHFDALVDHVVGPRET